MVGSHDDIPFWEQHVIGQCQAEVSQDDLELAMGTSDLVGIKVYHCGSQ